MNKTPIVCAVQEDPRINYTPDEKFGEVRFLSGTSKSRRLEMNKTPIVYVVQENSRINYTPAEKFGEVRFLTADEYSPSQHSIRNKRILEDVTRGLSVFDPDVDYIILSGNPIVMSYAFSVILARKGYVKALWYQSMTRDYVEVSFNPQKILNLLN